MPKIESGNWKCGKCGLLFPVGIMSIEIFEHYLEHMDEVFEANSEKIQNPVQDKVSPSVIRAERIKKGSLLRHRRDCSCGRCEIIDMGGI